MSVAYASYGGILMVGIGESLLENLLDSPNKFRYTIEHGKSIDISRSELDKLVWLLKLWDEFEDMERVNREL